MIHKIVIVIFLTVQRRTYKISFYFPKLANQSMFEKDKWDIYTTRGLVWKQVGLPFDSHKTQFRLYKTSP